MEKAVLAQYAVRSKQGYIYKTNKIRQISGASENIRYAFELLLRCAKEQGLCIEPCEGGALFSLHRVKQAFAAGTLDGIVLFEGGGNLTVLYAGQEKALRANRAFTFACLNECPGMTPLCVLCEADLEKDNYKADYAALMAASNTRKNEMTPCQPVDVMPFVLMDRTTNQPIATDRDGEELTAEARAKRTGNERLKSDAAAAWLDDLVTKRGEESLLAVVYADGNGMGVKVQQHLDGKTAYDECVNAMRAFSTEIDTVFVQKGYERVEQELETLRAENPELAKREASEKNFHPFFVRRVIGGGDEITFICNARWGLRLAAAYLDSLPAGYSSCAGIAVFHSHYPFAETYRMAESCCENAKQKPHADTKRAQEEHLDPKIGEQCWLDWHFIHSGIGGDVEDIRAWQGTDRCMARPWQRSGGTFYAECDLNLLYALKKTFAAYGVTRTNIKTMGAAFERSAAEGRLELERICSHAKASEEKPALKQALEALVPASEDTARRARLEKALYDFAEMFDLWFAEDGKGGDAE